MSVSLSLQETLWKEHERMWLANESSLFTGHVALNSLCRGLNCPWLAKNRATTFLTFVHLTSISNRL